MGNEYESSAPYTTQSIQLKYDVDWRKFNDRITITVDIKNFRNAPESVSGCKHHIEAGGRKIFEQLDRLVVNADGNEQ